MSGRGIWAILVLGVSTVFLCAAANPASSAAHSSTATQAHASNESVDSGQCRKCHLDEVNGFARSKMAHSMRLGGKEPSGIVRVPGATITMSSDTHGSWQTLESGGATAKYHVDYVIGSGAHATGYIMDLDGHLFQSPVSYYTSRAAYDLAPGYKRNADVDFTRPIGEGCIFCHAGSSNAIAGTANEYAKPPFNHLGISCDRCHGSSAAHLAKPVWGNIVDPPHLAPAARDSVCEQCHLIGVARVLNPGKRFTDFVAGKPLEDTFTIYRKVPPVGTEAPFKVISQSEELALSKCERSSGGQMWCGTCHDPHNEPTHPVAYYRERCLLCHAKTNFAPDHPAKTSNCIGCHMPKRKAFDGGHTAFTDHRIRRRPDYGVAEDTSEIAAWRKPPMEFETRNLGIATIDVGLETRSAPQIIDGYRMLVSVQNQFPEDSEMYRTIGDALFAGRQYSEAAQAFELAVRYDPTSSQKEAGLGQTYEALGERDLAQSHLEKAMQLDPLNLSAASLLINLYNQDGEQVKMEELSKKIASLVQRKAN